MIRRVFWLSVGAAAGITSYRRATAMGRAISARMTGDRSPAVPGPFWPLQPGQAPPRPRVPSHAQALPRNQALPGPRTQWSTARAAWRTSRAAWRTQKAAIAQVRSVSRFARDVREGMDLYMNRQQEQAGPTLTTTARPTGAPGTTAPGTTALGTTATGATSAPGTTATNGRPRGRTDHVKDGR
jgi:hypothetical protein